MKLNRNEQALLTMLRGVRNAMAAAVDMIDVALDAAEQLPQSSTEKGQCPHPMATRTSRASMGHPHRFHCGTCDMEVEE
jgi:hypothetical protein